MQFAIGIDHFGELRRRFAHFVDKTGFIKELFERSTTFVTLITRPRRFGKTLNLSMLQHFLAAEIDGKPTRELFKGLWIESQPELMAKQGQSPVIFMTFKDVKATNLKDAEEGFARLIARLYQEHQYLLVHGKLIPSDAKYFNAALEGTLSQKQLEESLLKLSQLLEEYHGRKPWILIDEYDAPLHSAYFYNYHQELIPFVRNLLSSALKTNSHLDRAVLTGVTRIARESLFSGLNNPGVYTIMDQEYSAHFGFTEPEVQVLLQACHLESKAADIKAWFNGYLCGDTVLYNPWSIINSFSQNGALKAYWVNTGGTDLIRKQLASADENVKVVLEALLQGKTIEAKIHLHWTFDTLASDLSSIMSLLLAAGYLKVINQVVEGSHYLCHMAVPNREVMTAYTDCIMAWFRELNQESRYQALLKTLVNGQLEDFSNYLNEFLDQTVSYFDVTGRQPERFYHGFVLGLVVALADTHTIESNRESGMGRYDVMIIPKDTSRIGLVIEFKVASSKETLPGAAENALNQIQSRNYVASLQQRGIQRIFLIGMAFQNKQVEMVWKQTLALPKP